MLYKTLWVFSAHTFRKTFSDAQWGIFKAITDYIFSVGDKKHRRKTKLEAEARRLEKLASYKSPYAIPLPGIGKRGAVGNAQSRRIMADRHRRLSRTFLAQPETSCDISRSASGPRQHMIGERGTHHSWDTSGNHPDSLANYAPISIQTSIAFLPASRRLVSKRYKRRDTLVMIYLH